LSVRIWYPQLDAYDAARRMATLVSVRDRRPLSVERLFICDFYLATPSLLHETSMPNEVRERFRLLKVPRPAKQFVSYPSPPILFRHMGMVQREAFQNLTGRGVFDLPLLERGEIVAVDDTTKLLASLRNLSSSAELEVASFLANSFADMDASEIRDFRRRVGLRRPVA